MNRAITTSIRISRLTITPFTYDASRALAITPDVTPGVRTVSSLTFLTNGRRVDRQRQLSGLADGWGEKPTQPNTWKTPDGSCWFPARNR